ncbi:glycoside hydrolase family 32 protein [Mangrovibacterium lignilyticum]|uniref:glycoside hydrolase family 32 protein n=1 Tax=Mangrovibacterium lignilyticum TaxID=2668052 RepID=UPI0013D23354|nr:glycoside hydrolase family 32 protein [Mangrovibacterium lignilyticum]
MKKAILFSLLLAIILGACTESQTDAKLHPGIHFSLNDSILQSPVELLFYDGSYHLFYSYITPGEIEKWGQVESQDLIHWENGPLSLGQDSAISMEMGAVVLDWNNTSGLNEETQSLVALYQTSSHEVSGQHLYGELKLSYSNDNGASWTDYTGSSIVLDNYYEPIRDIKIIWNDDLQKWLMLALSGYEVRFYASDNLIDWEYQSRFGDDVYLKTGEWTGLDFFPMEVNETSEMKWVLCISSNAGSPNEGSGIQYFIGDFDGFVYKSTHNKPKWIDHGSDVCTGIVLSDYFTNDKPAVFMADIYNSIYSKFNIHPEPSGTFTLVRQFTLSERYNDYYLISKPAEAIETIEKKKNSIQETKITGDLDIKKSFQLPVEINLTFDVNDRLYLGLAESFGLKLKNKEGDQLMVGYQAERRYFFIADPSIQRDFPNTWDGFNYAPYITSEPTLDMKLIIDHSSVELFAMNGLVSLTRKIPFSGNLDQISLYAESGSIKLESGTLIELENIW